MATTNEAPSAAPTALETRDLPLRGANNPDAESFDIVATYHRLLAEDPDLTMPMAAIEALIEFLGHSNVSTVYETIDLVKMQSAKLRAAVRNPIALSHGTDLFQQYLIMSLKQPTGVSGSGSAASSNRHLASTHESFEVVRQHLLRNGRLFATRAKNGRERIAVNARKHIYQGTTVLAHGGSRVVGTLLARAAQKHDYGTYVDEPIRFKVIYAVDPALESGSQRVVADLRAAGVPVAAVPLAAVSYVMEKVDMVLVGAEAVTANGGVISRLGTYQIAQLARANRKPFFVAAEQHKFGKTFPLGQFDYGFDQGVIDFRTDAAADDSAAAAAAGAKESGKESMSNPVDYTPPEYIEAFFADHKVLTPAEVAKEVIDMLM
ncbi:translation initiation factor-like protein eif-2b subunit alpha [Xylariales sp. PMI_506]|nr:translation initiation factor-like protein eif-2b subunit alpha [Xylariales sp. PMI_506]